ncbi:uncharacterized protein BDR25DRAFT_329952 [Lindgomyces ingoldianus]|uniref:Uncharacterized protein n=1 Tax=Lindgomyces ingoldianus TaxID=673940 RepID=A0ACB6Q9H6_9PLEO|nr:uncharacterized protein BDR25DRAFT_329952 [Lindgomyces ingoldianus]KAF2463017.1 hypothetical protein BDR25DRAFT_329952 [Lindgomyces ingoldianus]
MLSSTPATLSRPSIPQTWTSLANITEAPRQEHITVFLTPSTINILRRIVLSDTIISTTSLMYFYSISQNSWKTMAPIPNPMNYINATMSGGNIYVLGRLAYTSEGNWSAIPDVLAYNPKKNEWEIVAQLPATEAIGSAALGGLGALEPVRNRYQDNVDVVSVFENSVEGSKCWTPQRGFPRAEITPAQLREQRPIQRKIPVFILDPCIIGAGWKASEAKIPTARGGVSAGVARKNIYTFSGEGNCEAESGLFNQTEVYDIETNNWQRLAPAKVARHGTSAVGVRGKMYIPGGGVLKGCPIATFDALLPNLMEGERDVLNSGKTSARRA